MRPQNLPTPQLFRLVQEPIPEPADGQVLLRTLFLSLDPYIRYLLNETNPYPQHTVKLGDVVWGITVSRVITSRHPQFYEGELTLGDSGWQGFALSDGKGLTKIGDIAHPSYALSAQGMPGFTAYYGLLHVGQPKSGETVVVSAATGAAGAVVGQIAKLKGAHAVGIASGAEKSLYAVEKLGFDACLDRNDPQLAQHLAEACPNGIDIYYENVGGLIFDAVLPLFNIGGRIVLGGMIAYYNDGVPSSGPDRWPQISMMMYEKRLRVQGFTIPEHYDLYETFRHDMDVWVAAGRVKQLEDIVDGLENTPEAFLRLLDGRNFGNLVVRVAEF